MLSAEWAEGDERSRTGRGERTAAASASESAVLALDWSWAGLVWAWRATLLSERDSCGDSGSQVGQRRELGGG